MVIFVPFLKPEKSWVFCVEENQMLKDETEDRKKCCKKCFVALAKFPLQKHPLSKYLLWTGQINYCKRLIKQFLAEDR